MASLPLRDPVGDHLLTPHNAAVADSAAREFLRNADPVLSRDRRASRLPAPVAANHRDPVTPRHLPAGNPGGGTPLAGLSAVH